MQLEDKIKAAIKSEIALAAEEEIKRAEIRLRDRIQGIAASVPVRVIREHDAMHRKTHFVVEIDDLDLKSKKL